MILALIFAVNAHAIDFTRDLKGRWKRQNHPNDAVMIHPNHLKFRFCRKANVTAKRDRGSVREASIGLDQQYFEYDLYTQGNGNDSPNCLLRGHHSCNLVIGKWDNHPDKLFLMVSCDNSETVKMYEKRIFRRRR